MKARIIMLAATLVVGAGSALGPVTRGAVHVLSAQSGSVADQASIDSLVRDLDAADGERRASAACRLGKMGSLAASAVPRLVELLADATDVRELDCGDDQDSFHPKRDQNDPTTVGEVAAVSLARIGEPSREPVLAALSSLEWRVRMNAAFALGLFGGERAVEPLVRVLRDPETGVRGRAAWSLGLQGDERAVEPLVAALDDTAATVRSQAAWSLGLKGDERAVEPLMRHLDDESSAVRSQVAWALGLKGDGRATEALASHLDDPDASVQSQAAWALGMKGDASAQEPLTRALKSPDRRVRQQAAWALGMIGLRNGHGGMHIDVDPRPDVSVKP